MVSMLGLTKLARKRTLAGGDELPEWIRWDYPEGQRAALVVIARIARRKGQCDLNYDRIGKLAGVGRSTVRAAVKAGEANGHLFVTSRASEGEANLITLGFE